MADIPSQLVRLLVAVVDAGSIAGAARDLGVSHASLAASLKKLEDEVGFTVLVRGPALQLTDAGTLFLYEARRVAGDLSEIERLLETAATRRPESITVISSPDSAGATLPLLIGNLLETAPRSRIDLLHAPTPERALDALRAGHAEAALVSMLSTPTDLESIQLGDSRLVLVAPAAWALGAGLSGLRQSGSFPFIAGRPSMALEWALGALRRNGAEARIVARNAPADLIPALVRHGVGAALVPQAVAHLIARDGGQIVTDVPSLSVPIRLVRRIGLSSTLVQKLFELAADAVA